VVLVIFGISEGFRTIRQMHTLRADLLRAGRQ
jgi:hypothetical protein